MHGTDLRRWLLRLEAAAPARQATPATFAEQLAPFLGWAEAIALASTLQAQVNDPQGTLSDALPAPAAALAQARQRAAAAQQVHEELSQMILSRTDPQADLPPAHVQRRMHERIAAVRADLRIALAACGPALRHLAELDQALEHALSAREQQLLATLPQLFKPQAPQAQGDNSAEPGQLLLAELQTRWLPVAGLLQALAEQLKPPKHLQHQPPPATPPAQPA